MRSNTQYLLWYIVSVRFRKCFLAIDSEYWFRWYICCFFIPEIIYGSFTNVAHLANKYNNHKECEFLKEIATQLYDYETGNWNAGKNQSTLCETSTWIVDYSHLQKLTLNNWGKSKNNVSVHIKSDTPNIAVWLSSLCVLAQTEKLRRQQNGITQSSPGNVLHINSG